MPNIPPKQFAKPALGTQKLIDLLAQRGLPLAAQDDLERMRDALKTIGYFRLTGYMLPFQTGTGWKKHAFLPGTSTQKIMDLYRLDKEIRFHCLDALESIEVAVRAGICDHLSRKHGPHWQTVPAAFKPGKHQAHLEALAKVAEFRSMGS